MTKKEIVKEIAERANETQLKTKQIVQWTFDAIIEALMKEGRIELRNFGIFEVKRRKARLARNPKTEEPVDVPAKNVVSFQAGKEMEDRVQKAHVHQPKKKNLKKKKKIVKKGKVSAPPPPPPSPPDSDSSEMM